MGFLKTLTNLFKPKEKEIVKRSIGRPRNPVKQETTSLKVVEPKIMQNTVLTEPQQTQLCKLIAEGNAHSEIVKYMQEEFGVKVGANTTYAYRNSPKWGPVIRKMRELYMASLEEVPSYHKRVRLERVEKAFDIALEKKDSKNILASVHESRAEVEGDGSISSVDINILNLYKNLSDEEIELRRSELIKKIAVKPNKEITNGQKCSEDEA